MNMSEAPKKIWFDQDYLTVGFEPIDDRDIPYIRADIVDELVEALKEIYEWTAYKETPWAIKTKAALAKLEESHD